MTRIVIVGAGQAGAVAIRTLRRRGFDGPIEMVGSEPYPPYQRPPLSKEFLERGDDDGIFLLTEGWCEGNGVRLRVGQTARRVLRADGVVELADDTRIQADLVLIATGGSPRLFPGVQGERIHYLRTLHDSERLRGQLQPGAHLIVVGAGFVGSEVAAAARARGATVTLIEGLSVPLQHVLGRRVGEACAEIHRANGVALRLGEPVVSIAESDRGVTVTTHKSTYEGDLVVIGIGITPNVEVAVASGLAVGDGVLVDEYCRTGVANVYAAGDVANHFHPVFQERVRVEHFDNASKQAAVAASNMIGHARVFDDPHWFWSDQYDFNLQYAGHAREWDEIVVRGSLTDLEFCAFYLRDHVIRGAFGIGRGDEVALAKDMIARSSVIDPAALEDEDVDLAELAGTEEWV